MKQSRITLATMAALALCGASAIASLDLSSGTAAYTWVQTDQNGVPLTGNAAASGTAVAVNTGLFALTGGYWVKNDSAADSSKTWISVDQYGGQIDGSGNGTLLASGRPKYGTGDTYFKFTTTFNSGANTHLIGKAWYSDNMGLSVVLTPPGNALPGVLPQYSTGNGKPPGSFSADLIPNTTYTVDFLIKNAAQASGNPLGLNINMAAVPEPTTMIAGALLLLPFGASTIRRFRKNRAA